MRKTNFTRLLILYVQIDVVWSGSDCAELDAQVPAPDPPGARYLRHPGIEMRIRVKFDRIRI